MARQRPRPDAFAEFTERFGQRVAAIRERRRWTQAKLAEELDVGDSYLGKLEVGIRRPSFRLIFELAERLRVPPRELFNFDESDEWQSAEWEAETRRFRRLLEGKPAEDVRLLYEVAARIFRE